MRALPAVTALIALSLAGPGPRGRHPRRHRRVGLVARRLLNVFGSIFAIYVFTVIYCIYA